MVGLAARLAAACVAADNINSDTKLPELSFWDAFVPTDFGKRFVARPQADKNTFFKYYPNRADADKAIQKEAEAANHKIRASYYEIEKRRPDKKVFISRKGKSTDTKHANKLAKVEGVNKSSGVKQERHVTIQKVVDWTKGEDDKLKALKAANTSWKHIIEQVPGRSKQELQTRYKELQGLASAPAAAVAEAKTTSVLGKQAANPAWTAAQDEKLKAMQAAGTKFNLIAPEVGKTVQEVAARAKELELTGKKSETKKNAVDNDKIKDTANTYQANKKKKDVKAGSAKEANYKIEEWQRLVADSMISLDELKCLAEILNADNNPSWRRIAARFYDLTGRRVNPDDIRDKFIEMSSMQ